MSEDGDICPICKSSRYLNPDMKFLVNPQCYHKMCESCVDRLFAYGPVTCPHNGCEKILRKNKFKTQIFEDVAVEKEVDVRQRVMSVMNKREDEFDTLDEYNAYLEKIEDSIFTLLSGTADEKEALTKEIEAYEKEHKAEIIANNKLRDEEDKYEQQKEDWMKEQRKANYLMAVEEQRAAQEDKETAKRELVHQLATSNKDASSIEQNVQKTALKRSSARTVNFQPMPTSRYFEKVKKESSKPETPFTPFNGDRQIPDLFEVQDHYDDKVIEPLAHDIQHQAGGFTLKAAYARILQQAFVGLGVDVQAELLAEEGGDSNGTASVKPEPADIVKMEEPSIQVKVESTL